MQACQLLFHFVVAVLHCEFQQENDNSWETRLSLPLDIILFGILFFYESKMVAYLSHSCNDFF